MSPNASNNVSLRASAFLKVAQRLVCYLQAPLSPVARINCVSLFTGFKHVEAKNYRTRLLHIKGKKHIRVTEVPLTHKSLNSGDVFIVDAGTEVIQWNGSASGALERSKVLTLASLLGKRYSITFREPR